MVLRGLKLSYTSCNESTTIIHTRRFQIQIEKVSQTCSSFMLFGYALIKNRLRGFERSFRCCGACKTKEDYKEGYLMVLCGMQTVCLLVTLLLGYTLRVLVTSYQFLWQCTSFTKISSKFQVFKLSEKLIR